MSSVTPSSPIRDVDYDALESALTGTDQGRWFLAEFLRRNQPAEYASLRESLKKLEHAIAAPEPTPDSNGLRRDLVEMSEAIARTKLEIAAIRSTDDEDSRLITATGELDAIVSATEKATSDILEAAEDVQEVAWLMREKGLDEAACDRLDERATEIYMSCSFQDITGQRIDKVVNVLRFLESRVVTMIKIWGLEVIETDIEMPSDDRPDAELLNGPQLEGLGLDQDDIDLMIAAEAIERDVDDIELAPDTEGVAAAEMGPESDAAAAIEPAAVTEPAAAIEPAAAVTEPAETQAAPAVETAEAEPPQISAFEPAALDEAPEKSEAPIEALDDERMTALFS